MAIRAFVCTSKIERVHINSNDGTEAWESGVKYGIGTLVSYSGLYFISRKDVPDTITNPIGAPEYWAQTEDL